MARPHAAYVLTLGAAAALALGAPPAQAATAGLVQPAAMPGTATPPKQLQFQAARGETNKVGVTSVPLDDGSGDKFRWIFKDTTAPVTAGEGCNQEDAHTVTCSLATPTPQVLLGDEDDELTSDSPVLASGDAGDDTIRLTGDTGTTSGSASGGPGDDLLDASLAKRVSLSGGDGGDLLIGSDFDDELHGGRGVDELRGGKGDDTLSGETGADKFTCGADEDTVQLDLSDRLLDPDTPTLATRAGAARADAATRAGAAASRAEVATRARATRAAAQTDAATDADHASLKTDCERLQLPAGPAREVGIDVGAPGAKLDGRTLTLGRRISPKLATANYEVQLRDTAGKLLARGSLRSKTIRFSLTRKGTAALKPGSRRTVRLLTRPEGAATAGPKSRPGVQVDLTIPK